MINCHLSIILVADSRKKNRTSIVVLTKKKNFRELQALEWAENAHFGSEKRDNPWMDRKPGMTLDGIGLFFQRDNIWVRKPLKPYKWLPWYSFWYLKCRFILFRFRVLCRQIGSFGTVRLGFPSLTGGTRFAQTPPVGRSENLTGPSFLLQWSSATKPCIFRQHYRAKKESFIEWKSRPPWPEYGYLGYLIGLFL